MVKYKKQHHTNGAVFRYRIFSALCHGKIKTAPEKDRISALRKRGLRVFIDGKFA